MSMRRPRLGSRDVVDDGQQARRRSRMVEAESRCSSVRAVSTTVLMPMTFHRRADRGSSSEGALGLVGALRHRASGVSASCALLGSPPTPVAIVEEQVLVGLGEGSAPLARALRFDDRSRGPGLTMGRPGTTPRSPSCVAPIAARRSVHRLVEQQRAWPVWMILPVRPRRPDGSSPNTLGKRMIPSASSSSAT